MAKRKSTDKTSKDETDQKVETDRAPDQSDASETEPADLEVAAEAVESAVVENAGRCVETVIRRHLDRNRLSVEYHATHGAETGETVPGGPGEILRAG